MSPLRLILAVAMVTISADVIVVNARVPKTTRVPTKTWVTTPRVPTTTREPTTTVAVSVSDVINTALEDRLCSCVNETKEDPSHDAMCVCAGGSVCGYRVNGDVNDHIVEITE